MRPGSRAFKTCSLTTTPHLHHHTRPFPLKREDPAASRKPGLLVCRKEGLSHAGASEVPGSSARNRPDFQPSAMFHGEPGRSFSTASVRERAYKKLTCGRDASNSGRVVPELIEIAPVPPVPSHDLPTYGVPDALRMNLQPGMRVRVPLGRQTRTGVVAGFTQSPPPGPLRSILEVLDRDPFLPAELLELCRWTSRYYLASLADVIGTIVPSNPPGAARERVLRLVRRLDASEESTLARRCPARARAYHALATAPGDGLTLAEARACGVAPAA